ncbi:MAG: hypothetical protein A2Z29_07345 [Chloroflexi bacterium RBG_16_56_11]|nr:MAG: hypothetical protein A2Z29_07345 [Chloroflexi bacterium RBG_16_56_11]
MISGIFWPVFVFSAIALFVIGTAYRVLSLSRQPVHLRWELSPIPHVKGRGSYGGSDFEEFEWWKGPRRRSLLAPLAYMAVEIFLLRSVFKNNKRLWPFSLGMHLGVYLIILTAPLYVAVAIILAGGMPSSDTNSLREVTYVLGVTGYLLGISGVLGLLVLRSVVNDLRSFTSASGYFNLAFLGAVFLSGINACLSLPDFTGTVGQYAKDLITLDPTISIPFLLSLHVIISILFLIYLPWTNMSHFIAKYFTYHSVRWNDAPRDAKMDTELRRLMGRPVSWSAGHVQADGDRSWIEIATEKATDEKTP